MNRVAVAKPESQFCKFMGLLVEFTSTASLLWILFITVQIFLFVSWKWNPAQVIELDKYLFVFGLVIPLITCSVLWIIDAKKYKQKSLFGDDISKYYYYYLII